MKVSFLISNSDLNGWREHHPDLPDCPEEDGFYVRNVGWGFSFFPRYEEGPRQGMLNFEQTFKGMPIKDKIRGKSLCIEIWNPTRDKCFIDLTRKMIDDFLAAMPLRSIIDIDYQDKEELNVFQHMRMLADVPWHASAEDVVKLAIEQSGTAELIGMLVREKYIDVARDGAPETYGLCFNNMHKPMEDALKPVLQEVSKLTSEWLHRNANSLRKFLIELAAEDIRKKQETSNGGW